MIIVVLGLRIGETTIGTLLPMHEEKACPRVDEVRAVAG
jgi:hypothetical protein